MLNVPTINIDRTLTSFCYLAQSARVAGIVIPNASQMHSEELLWHNGTMIYTHVIKRGGLAVQSPLERLDLDL